MRGYRCTTPDSKTPAYQSWLAMRRRCRDINHKSYCNYGAKGIDYPETWNNFTAFLHDVGQRPAGTSLGRIDNRLGYSKENCRWETAQEQAGNKSSSVTTKRVMCGGVLHSIADIARYHKLSERTIRHWIQNNKKIYMPEVV